jgi:TRAP-type C4-dicarboxylate transport system permease small subunit
LAASGRRVTFLVVVKAENLCYTICDSFWKQQVSFNEGARMLIFICTFLGGIALFLYGMQLMGDGLQKAAGAKLQQILAALTGVLAMGVFLGALVTAILQSSSATTVMTVRPG